MKETCRAAGTGWRAGASHGPRAGHHRHPRSFSLHRPSPTEHSGDGSFLPQQVPPSPPKQLQHTTSVGWDLLPTPPPPLSCWRRRVNRRSRLPRCPQRRLSGDLGGAALFAGSSGPRRSPCRSHWPCGRQGATGGGGGAASSSSSGRQAGRHRASAYTQARQAEAAGVLLSLCFSGGFCLQGEGWREEKKEGERKCGASMQQGWGRSSGGAGVPGLRR